MLDAYIERATTDAGSRLAPSPILFLVLIFGGLESWRRWKARATPQGRAYYAIPARTRALVAATYLGLAAPLGVGVAETFIARGL